MNEMDRHCALADRRRNLLDAAGPDVSDRKYSRYTRLEQKRGTAQRPFKVVIFSEVWASNDEAFLIQDKGIFKPLSAAHSAAITNTW